MRVLQVIDSLAMGGAEVLLTQLHAGFHERGIECEYYLLKSANSTLERGLLERGARVHVPLNASVYSPLHVLALHAHLRANTYEIVHVHLFPAQLWVALAASMTRTNTIFFTTEHNTTNRRRAKWFRGFDRFLYAHYAGIACISQATLTSLVQWCPEVSKRVIECPNGIDVDEFASATALDRASVFSVPETTPVVLTVGRLENQKDHETLIRAISGVRNVHLAIVGTGCNLGKLQLLADTLGVSERVQFLGIRRDVPHLLKTADIYVQSSRWEGFGIAALEAMASGLPVVASDVPGLAEVVGEGGLLFPPGDHERLAECLNLLIASRTLWQRMSHAGKRRSQEFSIARTRDCYEELYRGALGKRKQREMVV